MADLASEPTSLYRFFDVAGELLYVGITARGFARWHSHNRDKPWWSEVRSATVEHHLDRASALEAERSAIINEHPRHNVVHNARRGEPAPAAVPAGTTVDPTGPYRWVACRGGGEFVEHLWLEPEPNGWTVMENYMWADGTDQLWAWVKWLKKRGDDTASVPIYWHMPSVGEAAPHQEGWVRGDPGYDWYTWASHPTHVDTGEPLDWFSLPVRWDPHLADAAQALNYTPAPLQQSLPLSRILKARRQVGLW